MGVGQCLCQLRAERGRRGDAAEALFRRVTTASACPARSPRRRSAASGRRCSGTKLTDCAGSGRIPLRTNAVDEYWAGQTRIQKEAAAAWLTFAEGKREAAIAAMRMAAEREDASEKNVAMENKVVPIRALLGELYLAAQMPQEALAEFEASQRTMPNRFRTIAGAATAARAVGSVEGAKRYYRALAGLAVNGDGERPELAEAKTYLTQN
jgi:hypothetical protein